MPIVAANKRSHSVQLVARIKNAHKGKSVVHQDARYARNREYPKGGESRSVRGSVVHQDARYEKVSESRTEVKSFVHQNSGYGLKVKMRVGDKVGGYEQPF